jgi:hypothetical protein
MTFLLHLRTGWDDYFTVTNPTKFNSETYTSRQSPSNSYVYFSNCLFKSILSSGNGGALYCSSTTYFLVESTSFFSCKTSNGYGGAVYFSNSGGQSVLNRVCGYDCSSNPHYQFEYIGVNNAASSKNFVNYSSISRCVNENSNTQQINTLNGGNICCPSVNFSLNKCQRYSIITCFPYFDSSSVTCSFSYSTIVDIIAIGNGCFWLNTAGANFEIKSCNILRNTQGDVSSYGTIYTTGNLMIENSCILENNANNIFYQGSSYTITLSNCTVDKPNSYGSFKIQNTVTKSFILALNHLSTQNCNAAYDSAGTLIPIIQTSSSKKQIRLCTCGEFLYQPRLSDFFSLTSVFIFHIIYLRASI